MKVSDYIADYLASKGIKQVFGYQGGMITHVIDSIGKHPHLEYIQCYHEQTAAIAAEGYAKETRNIGCALSSSGPGVTNMMTGIADAYFDSVPVLYLTGQVNTYEYKYDKPIRQQGFQEMEVVELVKPITKYSVMVDHAEDIPYELEKAFFIAQDGRKGPVLLDIPLNIQREEIDITQCRHFIGKKTKVKLPDITTSLEALKGAKRPMILLGAGCLGSVEMCLLSQFLSKNKCGIVTSLLGKGSVDEDYPYFMGLVGSYGNRSANIAISKTDVLLVLGSRLDTRQTGARMDAFMPTGTIIHVNDDKNELLNHRLDNRISVNYSVFDFMKALLDSNITLTPDNCWLDFLSDVKTKYSQDQEIKRLVDNATPYLFIQKLNEYTKDDDVIVSDIGQNQMWTAQTAKMKVGMRYYTSGGLAPMGYSMPTAIGVSFVSPHKKVYAICGDGAFHMSSQSLGVIAHYKLPIKVVIMNNNSLGMINQFQRLYFDSRFFGTHPTYGYENPNYEQMSRAYGLIYYRITEENLNNKEYMDKVFNTSTCLIEYIIDGFTSVCPKLEYDKPIENPSPSLSIEEFEQIFSKLG
ncbi:MAG: thiamine pyrophosphate-binding protein [Erysipelotrichia bacterium]|nr:thiamine pyrophosphate-binding protein [Erysipelotrichia bacterium]